MLRKVLNLSINHKWWCLKSRPHTVVRLWKIIEVIEEQHQWKVISLIFESSVKFANTRTVAAQLATINNINRLHLMVSWVGLPAVARNAGKSSCVRSGSGRSRRYSFSSDATSWTLCSVVRWTLAPLSNSCLNCTRTSTLFIVQLINRRKRRPNNYN